MKKKILLFLAVLALMVAFSGCGTFEVDTEALMTPPSLTEEQTRLNSALVRVIGENFRLQYPNGDGSSSAFMFSDLDGDGSEEALAFYTLDNENTRINILRKKEDDWVSTYEAAGFSGDIQNVRFMEAGKERLLVVQWNQEAGVYRFKDDRLETLYSSLCDGILTADLSGDGTGDLLIFSNAYSGRAGVRLIYQEKGEIFVTEMVDVNAQYGTIYSTVCGPLGDGRIGYFIDSNPYQNLYLTEILTLENGKLCRFTLADFIPYVPEETEEKESGVTIVTHYGPRGIYARNTAAFCADVNGDGVIEMPLEMREDPATQENTDYFYLQYIRYDGTETEPVWTGFFEDTEAFGFAFPEEWTENVEISRDGGTKEYRFTEKESGAEVLRLKITTPSDFQDHFEEGYMLAGQSETRAIAVLPLADPESPWYLEPFTVKERFSFIKH